MNEYVPTQYHKDWMRTTFNLLKVGGKWGTTWAMYIKVDDNTLEVKMKNPNIPPAEVEENVQRVKVVCEAIGIKFVP